MELSVCKRDLGCVGRCYVEYLRQPFVSCCPAPNEVVLKSSRSVENAPTWQTKVVGNSTATNFHHRVKCSVRVGYTDELDVVNDLLSEVLWNVAAYKVVFVVE